MGEANRRTCIFCGGSGLSKEHIWPDWVRNHFLVKPGDKHSSWVLESEAKSEPEKVKEIERQGNLVTKKLRVVCAICNSGWMSKVEEAAKPIFLSIINGSVLTFVQSDLQTLSLWITLKCMVCEHSEKGIQVTPEEDRYEFGKGLTIPSYFRIYIGRHNTASQAALMRNSALLSRSIDGPNPPLAGLQRNTQTVSMVFDKLFIYVVACRESGLLVEENFDLRSLLKIHPPSIDVINWDEIETLDQGRMATIAHALTDFISSNNVKYGGQLSDKQPS